MPLIVCPACGATLSNEAFTCPKCAHPMKPQNKHYMQNWRGFEWRSKIEIMGWPLMHIAFGRNKQTGKFLVAKGIIAIGQFAIGVITIAQFGIGILFGFGQFVGGIVAIGQGAIGLYFGLGQLATGMTAIGQLAFGEYALGQVAIGKHIWTPKVQDPVAVEYFHNLWGQV